MSKKPTRFHKNNRRTPSPNTRRAQTAIPPAHVLYGLHTVRAALLNPERTKHLLQATPNALARLKQDNDSLLGQTRVELLTPRESDKVAGPEAVHQGVALKVSPLPKKDLASLSDYRLILILDQITDPHNVGAILRTACAFGASAVITTNRHAPQETGVLAKSASGALDFLPMIEVGNLGEAIKTLKKQAVWCVGLDSEADMALGQTQSDQNIALVLGAEGKGLRHKTRQLCDQMLRLDMPGPIKSLNVSNAAAVAMFALSPKTGNTP